MQYDFSIKNEKETTYRLIILIIVILHILFCIYFLFHKELWKEAAAALIIIALYSGYRLIISKTTGQKFYFGEGFFFLFGVVAIIDIWWVWIIDGVLYILSAIALQPIKLAFNASGIEHRVFPFKKYKWSDLSNVVLKDNILTIDFKNNKLLQREINTPIDETAFNAFAQEHLNKLTIKPLNN